MTTILLVDDQPLIRSGFAAILGSEPGLSVIGQASDGEEGIRLAHELDPDVICMDVQMPNLDGIEATRRLTSSLCRASILILTTFDRDDFLFDALQAGASGFLLKTAEAEELIRAVQLLSRGDGLLCPQVTRRVIARCTQLLPAVQASAAVTQLTAREQDTLLLLTQGLTNAEIAKKLVVSLETVKTHVSNILMKLQLRDRVAAVIWAYEHGVIATSGR